MLCLELLADIGRTDYVLRKKKKSFLKVQTIGKTKHVKFLQSNLQDNSNHELIAMNFLMERELIVHYLLALFFFNKYKTNLLKKKKTVQTTVKIWWPVTTISGQYYFSNPLKTLNG